MKFSLGSVVGLDIGTHTVKVAEIKRGLGNVELANYYETPFLKNEQGEHLVSETIKTLFSQHKLYGKKVIASLPNDCVTLRNLTFPFSDKKKINSIFKFELEGLLSLNPEEIITDYVTLKTNKEKTSILCVITLKETVKRQLQVLRAAGIDPDCLDLGSLALANSARFCFGTSLQECTLVLEIGAATTSVLIFDSGGSLNTIRSLPFGGDEVLRWCAEKGGTLSFEELKRKKIKGDVILQSDWEEPALDVLFQELKRIITSFSQDTDTSIERIYLCGGGVISGMRKTISEKFGIEVVRWNPLEGSDSKRADVPKGREFATAECFGLALSQTNGTYFSLDLRKDEFSKKNIFEGVTDKLMSFAILMGILIIVFTANLYNKERILEEELKVQKNIGLQLYREAIPGNGKIVNEVVQLKEKIATIKQEYHSIKGDAATVSSPMDLLRKITISFPEDSNTEIYHYSFTNDEARLEGEAPSLDIVDIIKSRIALMDEVKNIKITDTKLGGDKESVKFKIILFLKG